MDAKECRKRWLLIFFDEAGGVRNILAKQLGIAAPYLSQIIGEHPSRDLGDKVARRVEQKKGLQRGALDHPPPKRKGGAGY